MQRHDFRKLAWAFYSCRPKNANHDTYYARAWLAIIRDVGTELTKEDTNVKLEWFLDCCYYGDPSKKVTRNIK